jgi:putative transposase
MDGVKRVVRLKLQADASQRAALLGTLEVMNAACDALSDVAWAGREFRQFSLHRAHYADLRDVYGLAAQAAVRVIGKVADAYKLDQKTKRSFARHGAVAFDDRCLSWQVPAEGDAGTVSIWTVAGRLKKVPFVGRDADVARLRQFRQGETDLQFDGKDLFLVATLDIPTPAVREPDGWLGVDLGIVNIAVTSEGAVCAGKKLNKYRKKQQRLRAELQAKGTKAAKRRLKARRRKEARHVKNENHKIAKRIVAEAERTGKGIALEQLEGIRQRARLRKPQRTKLHTWAFHQLGQLIQAKAETAGVPVVFVNPAYTSQECAECGHTDRKNRPNQGTFACRDCGVIAVSADHNAARVIAKRAPAAWAAINQPKPQTALQAA